VFHIEKKVPNFTFNRIVIDVENQAKDANVYFVNYRNGKDKQVYASHVHTNDMKKFEEEFYLVSDRLIPYIAYHAAAERTIFLPEKQTKVMSYKYFFNRFDPERFKEALFNDPSNVVSNNVEYTDGRSMMTVDDDLLMLSYINPAEEKEFISNIDELLRKSINFVNEHGGWTGFYKYSSMDEQKQEVAFQLYDQSGYPIFNEFGLSSIVQVWGQTGIRKYVRPIFSLDIPLTTEMAENTLPSGREVLKLIQSKKGISPELLSDIAIGYKMTRDPSEPQVINLEPGWFYRYGQSWMQINPEELGGVEDGLEQN
jgi:regulatory protein YycH of two-component signal transduction system YycFG